MRRVAGPARRSGSRAQAWQSPPTENQWPESQHVQRFGHGRSQRTGPARGRRLRRRAPRGGRARAAHVVAFELGLPHRFLGGAVDDDGRPLYRVRTCTRRRRPRPHLGAATRCCPTTTRRSCARPATDRDPGHRTAARRSSTAAARPDAGRRARRRRPTPGWCRSAPVLRARRRRRCSTGAPPPPTGCAPSRSAPSSPRCGSIRTSSTSTTATCSPPRGTRPGSTCCLHVVRRDHGAEVANRVARRNVVAPWRDGGQSQFSREPTRRRGPVPADRAPAPAPGRAALRAPSR